MKLFCIRESLKFAFFTPLAIATWGLPTAALANEPVYTMTVIKDTSSGRKVLAGKYEHAIQRITDSNRRELVFESNTNLCVAYTKSGDLENAGTACNKAVEIMREKLERSVGDRSFPSFEARGRRNYLAAALSNRGVFHAAAGKLELAREDFLEAVKLGTKSSAPDINLARVDRAMTDTPDI